MPAPFIETFIRHLREQAGITLTEQEYDSITEHADSLEAAQRIAMEMFNADVDSVRTAVEAMGEESGFDLEFHAPQTIGERPEGAVYKDAQGQVLNIEEGTSPSGSLAIPEGSGITPEIWAEMSPTDQQGLIDIWGDTSGADDDTRNYLGLDDNQLGYTEIISAPGYTYTYGEGQTARSTAYMRGHTAEDPRMYVSGDEVAKWSGYSARMRNDFTEAMITAGMISEEDAKGLTQGDLGTAYGQRPDGAIGYSGTSRVQIEAFQEALATANYLGTTPMSAIFVRGETAKANKARGGGGGGRAAFSVPAQFRTIPDYETLQQRTKEMLRQAMGRDAEDWEMNLLADEMKSQHKSYNEKMIQASREAYNRGQHTVDIEVPDPRDRTQKFFEETYAGELNRRRDIGEASQTNNLMMEALTKGGGMVA